ncbi:unnamed protein product [Adineta ricciae]|uniref:TLDc domain-containing protein n=1 Tax=Adineta ricciae TaxID=249248 RepID=A0A815PPB8_ADIRI|nr:unnamed protein product [Adineta ricciae]CAF1468672.1 unnamed protein product [Adineta ricciae]
MASSSDKIKSLQDQCEQLTKITEKLNETITNAVADASNELKGILNQIKETNEEMMCTVTNDTNEWKQLKINLDTITVQGKVSFDVGGRIFSTTVQTLTKEKDTFFTALISKQCQIEKDDQGRYFIDRDGDLFAEILNFMRDPTTYKLIDGKFRERLIIEAEFYRLNNLVSLLRGYFQSTNLLDIEQQIKLNEFYGKTDQSWILIYKATRDGFEGAKFHSLCDNQGPTMTIIQSTNGHLFGGYASQSWISNSAYSNAVNSFLFVLKNANNSPPTKFIYNNNGNGCYNNPGYGPTFGGGHDLHIATLSNTNTNSYSNLGSSYPNSLGLGPNTFTGSRNFTVTDIEVFKLM